MPSSKSRADTAYSHWIIMIIDFLSTIFFMPSRSIHYLSSFVCKIEKFNKLFIRSLIVALVVF